MSEGTERGNRRQKAKIGLAAARRMAEAANAPDEPEITPAMIAAGGRVIEDCLEFIWGPSRGSAAMLAADVLRAAFRAKSDAERVK